MQKIGIIVHPNLRKVDGFVKQVVVFLKNEKKEIVMIENEKLAEKIDVLIVIGGDGSILGATRFVVEKGIPVVGINFGRVGFLADLDEYNYQDVLKDFFKGKFILDLRTMIDVEVVRGKELIWKNMGLNDLVINGGDFNQMIIVQTMINKNLINEIRGDGVIIATPTGSTAYSMSCNGPIILPTAKSLIVNAIAPFNLKFRPMIVNDDEDVILNLKRGRKGLKASIDGQKNIELKEHDLLRITKINNQLMFMRRENWNFLNDFKNKLN